MHISYMKKLFLMLLCAAGLVAAQAADGPLPGKFSVGENHQVQFSQGNLQYQPNGLFWRFAEHQYDYVGHTTAGNVNYAFDKCNNTLIDQYYDGWIDLFGWGTGDEPWNAAEESRLYSMFNEWGANTIMNGGFFNSGWRTLTWEEWFYLLVSRPHAENLRGQATVNKVHGLILLPDEWTQPKKLNFIPSANDWNTNTYSASQWKQMEQNGAVFLPAGGFRSGHEVSVVGVMGFYWSSTLYPDNADDARDIFFSEKRIGPKDHEKRFYGLSVRLVMDVPGSYTMQKPQSTPEQPKQPTTNDQRLTTNNTQTTKGAPTGTFSSTTAPAPQPAAPAPKPAATKTPNPVPVGGLPGIFSVSAGKQVYFSMGNAQYNEDGYYPLEQFAEHQWYIVGDATRGDVYYNGVKCDNNKLKRGFAGWADLFEWGGDMSQNSAFYTYSTFFGWHDWGERSFQNGGYPESGMWRTLTSDEWMYLFDRRPNARNLRGQATVCNHHGYILLPDAWQLPQGLSFRPQPNNWTTNTYTEEQWKQMEQNGAVFLPAAGVRNGKEIQGIDEIGAYWSSTKYRQQGESDVEAKGVYFTANSAKANMFDTWHHGFSVRLVQDIDFVKPKKKSAWDGVTQQQLDKLPPLEPEGEWKLYDDMHVIGDINPREGFRRVKVPQGSFAEFLRNYPLKGDWTVYDYTGKQLPAQAQFACQAVLDIDIGNRDLLQCADAVMLLRAEYLYSQKRYSEIHFNALSGKRMNYTDYVKGDYSKAKFRKYMEYVFAYANTESLEKEMKPRRIEDVQIGDVFVTSGNPGHAMIVVDMAVDQHGNRALLFAQGMMPARSVHVVTNLEHGEDTPWYLIDKYLEWGTLFVFPNYVFSAKTDLKTFE